MGVVKAVGRFLVLGTSIAAGSIALGYYSRRKEAQQMLRSPRLVSEALSMLGYELKADVGPWREASQSDIAQFQSDYNLALRKWASENPWYDARSLLSPIWMLPTHGIVTPATRMGIMIAMEEQKRTEVPFRSLAPSIVPELSQTEGS